MNISHITHPHAALAVYLAHCMRQGAPRDWITEQITETGLPRGLYVLACVLQAAAKVNKEDAA